MLNVFDSQFFNVAPSPDYFLHGSCFGDTSSWPMRHFCIKDFEINVYSANF